MTKVSMITYLRMKQAFERKDKPDPDVRINSAGQLQHKHKSKDFWHDVKVERD